MKITGLFVLVLLSQLAVHAFNTNKSPRGTVRGNVTDKLTHQPLPGAHIILLDTDTFRGTTTDMNGKFRFEGIKVGRISLKVTYIGYREAIIRNLELISGKELVVNIELEEMALTAQEVEIIARVDKTRPINSMASVSARGFTVEETQRFAGSRNDVARMAASYAGVVGANDARNDIIIRGNSPMGLLWKLEGAYIPNPNHWGSSTATGGPVSILNNNVLANSDFLTGAFPAEYGNALSGVFDLKLRNGNDEKHEFLGQIGFNGFEAGAEGPVGLKAGSSYMVNARYSTLEVLDKLGMDFGTGTGIPRFKDAVFKINLPGTTWGSISVFGIGGISDIEIWDSRRDTLEGDKIDFYAGEGYDLTNGSDMFAGGLVHQINLGRNARLRSIATIAYHRFRTQIDSLNPGNITQKQEIYFDDFIQKQYSLQSDLTYRINPQNNFRTGASVRNIAYDLTEKVWFKADGALRTISDFDGKAMLWQSYAQWQYRPAEQWTINTGLHYMFYGLNQTWSLEPRIGLQWNFLPLHTLGMGYGYHSQLNPITVHFRQTLMPDGSFQRLNEGLDMPKAHHWVISYDRRINEFTRLKLEGYLQWLSQAGVDGSRPTYFSMLNEGANFGFWTPDTLKASGTGFNQGLELTIERFLNNGLYYLATASLFDSKYKGSDGIERSTAFDGGYVVNALAGKEFYPGKKQNQQKAVNILAIDIKYTLAGGQRYTPSVVIPDPATGGKTFTLQFDQSRAYSLQYKDYQRFDLRIAYKRNGKRTTQEWALDIQNLFNTKNIYNDRLNKKTGEKSFVYQMGLLVIPQYRITF